MLITISMKTPDCVEDALEQALETYPDDQHKKIRDKFKKVTDKFFEYDECVSLTIDTDKGTCVVNKV